MYVVAYLPLIIALIVIELWSVEKAFLGIYLPCLLIFSQSFYAKIEGLPDISFAEAAILPIGLIFLLRKMRTWRYSLMDVLVLAFVLWNAIAEYHAAGYKQAQNVFFMSVMSVLFPYVLAKGLIERRGLRIKFAKRLAFLLFLNLIDVFHSVVFDWSIHDRMWRHVFPGESHAMWFYHRFGLPRLPVSFNHPILAGVAMAVGYRINRWLQWSKQWEPRFKVWHPINMSKANIINWVLLVTLIFSFARGPWGAFLLSSFLCGAALSRKPRLSLIVRIIGIALMVLFGWILVEWYVSLPATTEFRETIRFRWELVSHYRGFISEKPIFGWGITNWPIKYGHLRSVDNYFVYLIVLRGFVGFGIMVAIMGSMMLRLFLRCMKGRLIKPLGSKLAFTFLSIYVVFVVSFMTVWMDMQIAHIFFLITGWAESYLMSKKEIVRS